MSVSGINGNVSNLDYTAETSHAEVTSQTLHAEVAKLYGDDGISTETEKLVDKVLLNLLAGIDFSSAEGAHQAAQIKEFIAARAGKLSDADLQFLFGLLVKMTQTRLDDAARAEVNEATRARIRDAFVEVAKDGAGVGDTADERKVDKLLSEELAGIDFSRPGGAVHEARIRSYLHLYGSSYETSYSSDFSKGEIDRLRALMKEAAAALKAPPQVPASSTQVNGKAWARVYDAYVSVAADGPGAGSAVDEREVDQLLIERLPAIDFSVPGGALHVERIRNHLLSIGASFSLDEMARLRAMLDQAAALKAAPAPGGSAGAATHVAAWARIYDAFATSATVKDGQGVGDGWDEREIDKLLFEFLPQIDFSRPDGVLHEKRIRNYLELTDGDYFSTGEIKRVRTLLEEAAAALKNPTQVPADSTTANSKTWGRIYDTFATIAADGTGVGSGMDEREVEQLLIERLPQIDFTLPGGALHEKRIRNHLLSTGETFSRDEIDRLRALLDDAAALKETAREQTGSLSAKINSAAWGRVYAAFESVAKDGGGVADTWDERAVDKLLFEFLLRIDFSCPGGAGYENRIRENLTAETYFGGERYFLKHQRDELRAVLEEAAAALKPGSGSVSVQLLLDKFAQSLHSQGGLLRTIIEQAFGDEKPMDKAKNISIS